MSNLLIVESPAKIKTLKKILGDGWEIAASFGHVRDLPRSEIAIEPPEFKPKYEVIDRAKTTVAKLKKLAAEADTVYLGTDPDREGEAIAWHLSRVLNIKTPRRVRFNEITATAVKAAVSASSVIDINKVAAQEARRALDRLVGYMVSPVVTRALASTDPLSAGRVQSVALRLVVERERAIRDFRPVEHYRVQALFVDDSTGITWPAQWDFAPLLGEAFAEESDGDESTTQRPLWMDQGTADALVQALRQATGFTVIEVQQKPQRRRPPAPFTTSTMQQAASAKLHLSPERTMELAQKLYEAGIITYHRTDNCNLSDEGIAAIRDWVIGRKGSDDLLAETPNRWKNKEGAQEGHEATRPTDFNRTNLTEEETTAHGEDAAALYQLIWQRAVASQMRDAVYDATKAVLRSDALLNGEPQRFVATGRMLVEEGWMRLTKTNATDETNENETSENEQALPELEVGLYLEHAGAELQAKKTQASPRYTEAALVKHLEKEGVGRPSTYAAILKNITTRGYIEVKSRKIRATELGERIIDVLAGSFQFAEVQFTRTVESVLDRVAAGEFGYSAVVGKYYERLTAELGALPPPPPKPGAEDLGFVCPKCGKPLLRRKAKKNNRHFWGCSGYPECDVTLPDTEDETGGPAPDFDALDRPRPQVTEISCPKCGKGHLVRREGSRGAFYGCNKYPKCKATFEEHEGAPLIEEQEGVE